MVVMSKKGKRIHVLVACKIPYKSRKLAMILCEEMRLFERETMVGILTIVEENTFKPLTLLYFLIDCFEAK